MKTILIIIGQSYANLIIKRMERCETQKELDSWFEKGMKFNHICVSNDIYLD